MKYEKRLLPYVFSKDKEGFWTVDSDALQDAPEILDIKKELAGFDETHLDRIFAPFHRLHGRSSSYEETGMGLAICKKIVERHGGSITTRSKPGPGATFVITLPVSKPEAH